MLVSIPAGLVDLLGLDSLRTLEVVTNQWVITSGVMVLAVKADTMAQGLTNIWVKDIKGYQAPNTGDHPRINLTQDPVFMSPPSTGFFPLREKEI